MSKEEQKQLLSNVTEVALLQVLNDLQQAFTQHFASFLQFIEQKRADRLPPDLKEKWSPFDSNRHIPAAVLKLSDKTLLNEFLASYQPLGAELAVTGLLKVAWRMGVLSDKEAKSYGFASNNSWLFAPPETVMQMRSSLADKSSLIAKRNLLIMDLMLFGGLRSSEVPPILVSDVLEGDYLRLPGRTVRMPETLKEGMANYIEATGKNDGLLFGGVKHGKLSGFRLHRSSLDRIARDWKHSLGDLRFTCAMTALKNGVSLSELQHFLGFISMSGCLLYLGIPTEIDVTVDITRFITYGSQKDYGGSA